MDLSIIHHQLFESFAFKLKPVGSVRKAGQAVLAAVVTCCSVDLRAIIIEYADLRARDDGPGRVKDSPCNLRSSKQPRLVCLRRALEFLRQWHDSPPSVVRLGELLNKRLRRPSDQ